MPQTDTNKAQYSTEFPGLLLLLFIGLKLGGVIDWPWVWVLAPLWVPFALIITVLLIAAIISLIADKATGYKKPKR